MEQVLNVQIVERKRVLHTITGNEPHEISLKEASALTKNYREQEGNDAIIGGAFGREIFDKILSQTGCVGIRSYFGRNEVGDITIVLTGVNVENRDLTEGFLAQKTYPCPPYCDMWNDLNSSANERTTGVKRTLKYFSGSENHFITLAEAIQYTRNYQISMRPGEIKGGLFARNIFDKILAQNGCMGIRYYFAIEEGNPVFVIVGITPSGSDIVHGIIGERTYPCPPYCDAESVLQNTVSLNRVK